MVLQFQIYCTLGRWKLHLVDMFDGRDIINLGNVLPHKDVQEFLGEIISSSMPCRRVDFSKRVESFRRGLFLCSGFLVLRGSLPVVFDPKMDAHERGNGSNSGKVANRRSSREHPLVRRRQAEKRSETFFFQISKFVGNDSSESVVSSVLS